ncbi:MAG: ribonuclease P protein component [Microbacterium sp.]|uniref:ribonuclease P protein component n=1 Tax=Microbacterium sp. TaxID=51671 RepID=UPI001AD42F74|nr:ribonuclease P protein component [Microbacterium sp.]MBN9176870.1 ribonuclease P protein component [Microbacterium sp.]
MLARGNRITRGAEYKAVVRGGSRCAGPHTVTYVVTSSASSPSDRPARFGFIVSKQVGSAVTRNTVRRRLKAVCAEALPNVAAGADVVIRALPSAASADFAALRSEVVRCLTRRAAA